MGGNPLDEGFFEDTIREYVKEKNIDKITVLSIAPLFAETIKRINEGKPLGEILTVEE